ncbi:MAG: hypothetical protein WCW26_05670, partial [Candidatus Buchananbacteria bacterium]
KDDAKAVATSPVMKTIFAFAGTTPLMDNYMEASVIDARKTADLFTVMKTPSVAFAGTTFA